jgi:hypothetical protein
MCPGSVEPWAPGSRDGSGWGGMEIRWWRRRRAVAAQTEKQADEPRPAPIGSVDRAVRLNEGLRIWSVFVSKVNKVEG